MAQPKPPHLTLPECAAAAKKQLQMFWHVWRTARFNMGADLRDQYWNALQELEVVVGKLEYLAEQEAKKSLDAEKGK